MAPHDAIVLELIKCARGPMLDGDNLHLDYVVAVLTGGLTLDTGKRDHSIDRLEENKPATTLQPIFHLSVASSLRPLSLSAVESSYPFDLI